MRYLVAMCLVCVPAGVITAQQGRPPAPPPRYAIEADLDTYPQATPKDALRSVLKAIDARRIDYLLAHLADPEFVDQRVQALGRFEEVVRATTDNLADDPASVRELRRFLNDGEWQESGEAASAGHKEVKGRRAFFRKSGTRWFLENRRKPAQ
jgi:hypothetical protein